VSRLESDKLELTGSLCSMQQKLTELETVVQDLEDERVTAIYTHCLFFLNWHIFTQPLEL